MRRERGRKSPGRANRISLSPLFVLGRERRRDITTFYAFCRVIDDIADIRELASEEKRACWQSGAQFALASTERGIIRAGAAQLMAKYALAPAMLEEIIDGVEMDLTISQYATFEELRVYCYRVASAVGLVSIEIFGYRNPLCREYAIELGLALQMTNIIRDVGKDLENGRIYLPQEDLARFGYSAASLHDRVYDERFLELMNLKASAPKNFSQTHESSAGRRPALDDCCRNHECDLLRVAATDKSRQFSRIR